MEYRIALTQEEAFELSKHLEVIEVSYVKDEYTGEKRIRTENKSKDIREKEYPTPVKGLVARFSAKCKLGDIEDIWFEVKWTQDNIGFEVEFEGEVPEKFKNRPTIKGWQILE